MPDIWSKGDTKNMADPTGVISFKYRQQDIQALIRKGKEQIVFHVNNYSLQTLKLIVKEFSNQGKIFALHWIYIENVTDKYVLDEIPSDFTEYPSRGHTYPHKFVLDLENTLKHNHEVTASYIQTHWE